VHQIFGVLIVAGSRIMIRKWTLSVEVIREWHETVGNRHRNQMAAILMQGFYRTLWPKHFPRDQKIGIIKWVKQKEKHSYLISTSRSDYFRSIANTVTVFQRKLFRERTRIIEDNQPHFPVWMNFPNVPPPLPPGEEHF